LFTQERDLIISGPLGGLQKRDVTTVGPLGSLNNIMKLTRQIRVSPNQNTSRNTNRDPPGRNVIAALTVGRDSTLQETLKYIKEFTLERHLLAVINVGRDLLIQAA
jgi:hypothetical protein